MWGSPLSRPRLWPSRRCRPRFWGSRALHVVGAVILGEQDLAGLVVSAEPVELVADELDAAEDDLL